MIRVSDSLFNGSAFNRWHKMARNDTLTHRQRKTIAALLEARTVENAASLAGVGRRTIFRWLADPIFLRALHQAEGDVISEAVRVLIADLKENHGTLRTLRDDANQPSSVRLRAAVALDESLLRWRELLNFEERLTSLEEAVYDQNNKSAP
jgi:hypothetical protein